MLTPSATRFVGPLSFAALSRHPVETDVARPPARRADRAHRRRRHGRRDRRGAGDGALARRDGQRARRRRRDRHLPRDVGAGRRRAGDGRRHVDATRRRVANVARLRDGFGYTIVEPEAGPLASGQSGVGRLAELRRDRRCRRRGRRRSAGPRRRSRPHARRSSSRARDADLAGRHVVVTAGGTREPIDPVRFIGNRSTGKMGVAIAEAALDRGARVTLIAANVEVAAARPAPTIVRGRVDRRPARARSCARPTAPTGGRLRRAGHGGGRRRLPPGDGRRPQARSRRRPDARARADAGPAGRGRPDRARLDADGADRRPAPTAPGPRRVRRRDRLARIEPPTSCGARASTCWSPTTSPRPGSGLRDRHQPRLDPRPPTARARTCRCSVEARGRRPAARPGRRARWTRATPPRRLDATTEPAREPA